jgi:hypothetical protein
MYNTGYYATGYYATGYYSRQFPDTLLGLTWYSLLFEARVQLQDGDSTCYRYPDAMLLNALNRGINELARIRPEAYYEKGGVPEITELNWTQTVISALDMRFYDPLMWFVVGSAELSEDEYASDGRAAAKLERFERQVLGL